MTIDTFSEIGSNRPWIPMAPGDELDYTFEWEDWIPDSDSIRSVELSASGVTIDSYAQIGTKVSVWLKNPTPGGTRSASCKVTTEDGRIKTKTIYLVVPDA